MPKRKSKDPPMTWSRDSGPVKTTAPPPPDPLPEPTVEASVVAPPPERKIIYDRVGIKEYSSTSEYGALTPGDIVTIMGWETEDEYQKRMVAEKGGEPEHYLFGDEYHCLDTKGRKVRCWNNANNRPFDEGWCEDLCDGTILKGQWAGPLMMPGETVNGETIRISKYGLVLSGQHQMTACKLADEKLQESRSKPGNAKDPRYPAWNGHKQCVIETIVITGLSEDERILRTIDYVKPRTVADMLYTMPLFKERVSVERKELTRILSGAIDTLWARTATKGYKTHPEVVGFLERHRKLLKCVEHLFLLNRKDAKGGRKISALRLNVGMCSGLMYIMGSSGPKTDGDFYRNECPPSERCLDWSLWDEAEDFWRLLAKDTSFMQVRLALGRLVDSSLADEGNFGLGGRAQEKLALLANAWDRWKSFDPETGADPFDEEDLQEGGLLYLNYSNLDDEGNELPDKQVKLLDGNDFGGIDWPEVVKAKVDKRGVPDPPAPSREEIERATAEALARRGAR